MGCGGMPMVTNDSLIPVHQIDELRHRGNQKGARVGALLITAFQTYPDLLPVLHVRNAIALFGERRQIRASK